MLNHYAKRLEFMNCFPRQESCSISMLIGLMRRSLAILIFYLLTLGPYLLPSTHTA
jgi:hypothetical protein